MAYQTGTSSNIADLLDKFVLFAADNGWTINRNATIASGRRASIQKGSSHFHFRAFQNEQVSPNGSNSNGRTGLGVTGSDSFNASLEWNVQPGHPIRSTGNCYAYMPLVLNTGPFPAYHFFANGECLFAELEFQSGMYLRFGCGKLSLYNPSAGGEGRFFYSTGTTGGVTNSTASSAWLGVPVWQSSSLEEAPFYAEPRPTANMGTFLRVVTGAFDTWCGESATAAGAITPAGCAIIPNNLMAQFMYLAGVNPLFGNIVHSAPSVHIIENTSNQVPVGELSDIRYIDNTNYLPGEEFTIGADVWKVFPIYQKNGRSGTRGIAYRKT